MDTQFNPNIPIYLQIIDEIKNLIISGEWQVGYRIPSVRDLAQTFSVNPNTMQRALSELEREALLYSERTSGRYVTQDKKRIAEVRDEMTDRFVGDFVDKMLEMGHSKPDLIHKVQTMAEGRDRSEQSN